MSKIIKLSNNISSKIAAGEVVENPSAVIKELVENAIDANSTFITIEITDSGKSYIRVTDNGEGINKKEVELAFDRHATSKIKNIEDIYAISTLGFRGEALPSIAAVSRLEITTKTINDDFGVKLTINGGEIINNEKVGCKQGTTIIVNDLFYNTPARVKFLNNNSTEQRRINELINCLTLSNPNISFKYISNNEVKFITPGKGKLNNVILSIYGKETLKNVVEVNSTLDGIGMYGYVSNLSFTRGNSSLQIFFVNGRYIKSDILKDAMKIAYKTMIPINRHPICFLNFNIDYKEIDVNIHPSKTEIKFSRVGIIKQLIYTAIKAKLFEYNQTPIVSLEDKIFENTFNNDKVKQFKVNEDKKNEDKDKDKDKENINNNFLRKVNKNPFTNNENIESKNQIIENKNVIDLDIFDIDFEKLDKKEFVFEKEKIKKDETIYDDLKIIGQLFSTYILCEKNDNLYLLDQHAGHEKVLYEQLMDEYMNKTISSQLLFIPIQIKLSYNELEIIISKKNILNDLGFNVEIFGKDTLLVREVPILFNQPLKEDIVKNIILNLKEEYKNVYETNTELIIQKSCKNAIKAHDKLDILEIGELIDSLKKLDSPYTCPHGRPIIISISKNEIEKKFKRK
jgi:DNA mismatch repair protein MutL